MVRFSQHFLNEIRKRLPISRVIGSRVDFHKQKSNPAKGDFWACCPFHGEKTPSFHCDDHRGHYYCFGCHEKGDHFEFLMKLEGLSFFESVERLANLAGVSMPTDDPVVIEKVQYKQQLFHVMEKANAFFESCLQDVQLGSVARNYLKNRKIQPATQKLFKIGYAPAGRRSLLEYLKNQGVSLDEMIACGLVIVNKERNEVYDRFRDRLMFPITDVQNRVVAFSGRALQKDASAKYINSPETELFHKSQLLYNFAAARLALQQASRQKNNQISYLLVVEGYMDVIRLAQEGLPTVVAIMGTALTEDQMTLLWSASSVPILCLDGDQAGIQAAQRSMIRSLPLISATKSLRFCFLPEGKDPDDFVSEKGLDDLIILLNKSYNICDLLWQFELQKQHLSGPDAYAALDQSLMDSLSPLTDKSLSYYYKRDLRERLRLLWSEKFPKKFNKEKNNKNSRESGYYSEVSSGLLHSKLTQADTSTADKISTREAVIFMLFLYQPIFLNEFYTEFVNMNLQSPKLRQLRNVILDIVMQYMVEDKDILNNGLLDKGQKVLLEDLQFITKKVGLLKQLEQSDIETLRQMLRQALFLHRRSYELNKELPSHVVGLSEPSNLELKPIILGLRNELDAQD